MNARKQYHALDLAKFICAILIIVLHTSPFASYSGVLNYGFRSIVTVIAVPFFFVVSGFLFFVKINTLGKDEQNGYFLKYIKRLSVMYLIWSAVYFPFVLTGWFNNGFAYHDVLQYIKCFFFEGSYRTIWFLPALITATTTVYLLRKKFTFKRIVLISVPFYLFACLGSSYYGMTEKISVLHAVFDAYYAFFDTIKNGLLFGFIFVALGGAFAQKTVDVRPAKIVWVCIILFVSLAVETVAQSFLGWSKGGVDTKILLVPLSACLFIWVLSLKLPDSNAFSMMRKLSLLMFLSQRIFITLFNWFLTETVFVTN